MKLSNSGKGTAQNVQVTTLTIGSASTSQSLPSSQGSISPGSSKMTTYVFPGTAGAHGSGAVLKLVGTYTGGNFTVSTRVTLP